MYVYPHLAEHRALAIISTKIHKLCDEDVTLTAQRASAGLWIYQLISLFKSNV